MSSEWPCSVILPYFWFWVPVVNRRFSLLAFLKFQSYLPLSCISNVLFSELPLQMSPQEERSSTDPLSGLVWGGIIDQKGVRRGWNLLQKPRVMAVHQPRKTLGLQKAHELGGELMEMHSCKVTTKSTFSSPSKERLLSKKLETHLIWFTAHGSSVVNSRPSFPSLPLSVFHYQSRSGGWISALAAIDRTVSKWIPETTAGSHVAIRSSFLRHRCHVAAAG